LASEGSSATFSSMRCCCCCCCCVDDDVDVDGGSGTDAELLSGCCAYCRLDCLWYATVRLGMKLLFGLDEDGPVFCEACSKYLAGVVMTLLMFLLLEDRTALSERATHDELNCCEI